MEKLCIRCEHILEVQNGTDLFYNCVFGGARTLHVARGQKRLLLLFVCNFITLWNDEFCGRMYVVCMCSHLTGMWLVDQRGISKSKINSRAMSCSWTNDGQYLAVALYSGIITIRNKVMLLSVASVCLSVSPCVCLLFNRKTTRAIDVGRMNSSVSSQRL